MFDLNRWIQRAPPNHIAYAVGACFLIYYWDLIVTMLLLMAILWAIGKLENSRQ